MLSFAFGLRPDDFVWRSFRAKVSGLVAPVEGVTLAEKRTGEYGPGLSPAELVSGNHNTRPARMPADDLIRMHSGMIPLIGSSRPWAIVSTTDARWPSPALADTGTGERDGGASPAGRVVAPGDAWLARVENRVIAAPAQSLAAAADLARRRLFGRGSWRPDRVRARDVPEHAALARPAARRCARPLLLLSNGELTVYPQGRRHRRSEHQMRAWPWPGASKGAQPGSMPSPAIPTGWTVPLRVGA